MSTHWGYHCKTCGVDSETWLNHGESILEEIYKLAPEINRIKSNASFIEIEITVNCSSVYWDEEHPLEWLKDHEGHDICLKNEYGEIKEFDAV